MLVDLFDWSYTTTKLHKILVTMHGEHLATEELARIEREFLGARARRMSISTSTQSLSWEKRRALLKNISSTPQVLDRLAKVKKLGLQTYVRGTHPIDTTGSRIELIRSLNRFGVDRNSAESILSLADTQGVYRTSKWKNKWIESFGVSKFDQYGERVQQWWKTQIRD